MQGILIAAADAAVRKSLAAILQEGRTVHECASLAECLSLAAAHKMDYIFVDDIFEDGSAEALAVRLHSLGYGLEIIPILHSMDNEAVNPFRESGVRFVISKPFDVRHIQSIMNQIDEIVSLREPAGAPAGDPALPGDPEAGLAGTPDKETPSEVDVREISQRFRRLLARSLSREELVHAFADSLQEQFDLDNVVVLLPAPGDAAFRVCTGNISAEVKQQFFLSFDDPLVANLIRLGEPVGVTDQERLGRGNTVTAMRCGERLGIHILCPILSQGRALALVGLSRFHRYEGSTILVSLLRLFMTFFSKAMENAELYERVSAARETYENMVEALPTGCLAISADGRIRHLNLRAAQLMKSGIEELRDQPIERGGSLLADAVRGMLGSSGETEVRTITVKGERLEVSGWPLEIKGAPGILLLLRPPQLAPSPAAAASGALEELSRNMTRLLAHNLKNAMVPIKTCADLLPEKYQQDSFRQAFFATVQESLTRIDRWLEQLREFGELHPDRREWTLFPLRNALDKSLERATALFPELNVAIIRNEEAQVQVRGHRRILEQALFEVIRNALEAVRETPKPTVTVAIYLEGGNARLRVTDNGAGFEAKIKPHAFAPFTTRKLNNLGLGLAFAERVLQLHDGRLALVDSPSPGTCLQLVLPAAPAGENAQTGPAQMGK